MVALQSLLDVDELRLVARHLPAPQADVRWVATSELPDPSPFLEGGEVLLTTGLETATWAREWGPYVRRLAAVGVVAIGLAVDLTHDRSPDALLRACRRYDVGLFEVPRATTFVAVSRAAVSLLQGADESAARRALELQRELTQAALREDDPGALLERVARIGAMACIVEPDGVVQLGPVGTRKDLYDAELVTQALSRMRSQGLRAASSLGVTDGTLLVHPLGVRGRPGHYLVTGFGGRVSEVQRSAITTAVALLSLGEERLRAGREADRRLRARALELLVNGDASTAALVLELGHPPRPQLPKRPVVLRATGPSERLEDAEAALEAIPVLAGVVAGELVVITAARTAGPVTEDLAARGLRVGVGEPGPSVRASYETAGQALALTTEQVPVVWWEETVTRGVGAILDPDRAAVFAETFLAGVRADDQAEALLETLQSFLRHHGSLLKVADELSVHRNTVRHRVAQLEEALGRSLADPQTRVDAWVALRALERTS